MFLIPNNLENIDVEKSSIENFYGSDLPNQGEFDQEINLWKRYWLSENSITIKSLTETLRHIIQKNISQMFPNITRIISILLTTSATSATVERANSALRNIKIDFRSSMSEDRFKALILLYVHRDIKLNFDEVIDMYARKFLHRMLLLNPLSEN